MNRAEALARVTDHGGTGQRPALTADQVNAILDRHRLPDTENRVYPDPLWTETYDWAGATAEVWAVKAAKVAGDFNFTADDLKADKGDVLAKMAAMEAKYAGLSAGAKAAATGAGWTSGTLTVAGTNGPFDPVQRTADQVLP